MFSKTTEYALRSIVYIAISHAAGKKVGMKEVGKELELPVHFIGKILQDLVRKNVIASNKGPNGGFYLHRPGKDIKLMEIVEIFDGKEMFRRCGMGMKNCSDSHPCPLHNDIKAWRNHMLHIITTKTIQDLVDGINSGEYFITNIQEALPAAS